MKRFLDAMKTLDNYEGFYSEDSRDPGGETYRGISRVYFPDWWGWQIIDAEEDLENESIKRELNGLVLNFYRMQFWNRFNGDAVADHSLPIAIEMLECGVNLGVTKCVTFLQKGLNLLNLNGKLYPDLVEDGRLGPITLARLNSYLVSRPPSREVAEARLLKVMNILQGSHYIKIMEKYPEREVFRSWFNRT